MESIHRCKIRSVVAVIVRLDMEVYCQLVTDRCAHRY